MTDSKETHERIVEAINAHDERGREREQFNQAFLAAQAAKQVAKNFIQRGGKWRLRRKRRLIDAGVQPARVVARQQQSGNYNVELDGALTHIIARNEKGAWFVTRYNGHGRSGLYNDPKIAAQRYGLLIHEWK